MNDTTMPANASRPGLGRRIFVRVMAAIAILAAAALVIVIITLITAWRAPLWVGNLAALAQLHRQGLHSRTIGLEGRTVHYLEGGAGQPVVLVHGLGSSAVGDWRALAPALVHAGGFHVYALDLLGYGDSDKPTDRTYSMPEQAKLVVEFMNAEHLDRVALAGESMGGWIAATVAINEPERISRLILFDSAGMHFKLSFDPALFTPQTPEQVRQLMALVTLNPPPMPGFVEQAIVRKEAHDGWVVKRALSSMEAGHDYLEPKFATLAMPVLIVWGREDVLIPVSSGEQMHALAPQSVLEVYAGCGHIAALACVDRVAPRVIAFLNDNGPAPGTHVDVP